MKSDAFMKIGRIVVVLFLFVGMMSCREVSSPGPDMGMVLIPAGEFMMGGGEDDEKPVHLVKLDSFYIDSCEVTQEEYEGLMGKNPSKFKLPDRPVERLSWMGIARYCNVRSVSEGFIPCYDPDTWQCNFDADGYRLPTESEWEYACRAGRKIEWSFGLDVASLERHAWFKDNASKKTHPVGQKKPNSWGLYDMHGNVAEWCNDFYDGTYYERSLTENPRGPSSGKERVLRGGSWASSGDACRSSARTSETPGLADVCFGYETYGFRCVRKAD